MYSGIVSELRGSVKGTTFQRNAAGSIAKGKNNSRFSPSNAQSYELADFSTIASLWSNMAFGYKDEWNVFANANPRTDFWGNVKNITGYQWFMSVNRALSLIGSTLIEQGTYDSTVLPVPTYTLQASSSYIRMNFGAGLNLSDRYIIVNVTGPRRYSSSKSRQAIFYVKQVTGNPIQYIDFTSEWETFFGITWASFYAQYNAGLVVYPYSINIFNGVSSAYNIGYWSLH
jgi:hypothetical protein